MDFKFCEKAIQELVYSYHNSQDKVERSKIKTMINMITRKAMNYATLEYASEKAVLLAEEHNIDLKKMTWENQSQYDKGRNMFVYEHKTTANDISLKLINDPDNTLSILESMQIVWVTREEDNNLNWLGYRIKRPDHDKAYEDAKIKIVKI